MTIPVATAKVSYADLYARWEREPWAASEIDLEQDRVDWDERMTPEQHFAATWLFNLFFHGEHAVSVDLGPFIAAAPLEEQKHFLATQQSDEARHTVFFKRFLEEVVGTGRESTGTMLARTEPMLTPGHQEVFGRLTREARELAREPSIDGLARGVTIYHLLIEASMAVPGQELLADALERLDLLPGFREANVRISHDEQRHIGFGVRLLADLYEERPEETLREITSVFREVIPWLNSVAMPPDRDYGFTQSLGFSLLDLYEASARSMEGRFRAIGLPSEHVDRFMFPLDLSPRERAEQGLKLLSARVIGPRDGPVVPDPEAVAVVFDLMSRAARPNGMPDGTVIQWDFRDADPWYVRFAAGGARAFRGRAERPGLTLSMPFQDWIELGEGKATPLALIARRRLRLRGRRRLLLHLGKVFE